MAALFNGKDVLEMAVLIEQRGAGFYRKAAEMSRTEEQQSFFNDLAEMELQHSRIFTEQLEKAKLTAKKDSTDSIDAYFKYVQQELQPAEQGPTLAQADAFVSKTVLSSQPQDMAAANTSMLNLAQTAMGMEKDSVVFYLSMRENMDEENDKLVIDGIVAEELKHIRMLSKLIAQLKQEAA